MPGSPGPRQRPHVFLVDNHVFSSPNSSTIPPIPSKGRIGSDPSDALKPRWADARYPALPFTPLSPRFDSDLFSCLQSPRRIFPAEVSSSSYRLAPATTKALRILENDLRLMVKALETTSEPKPLQLPASYELFSLPRKHSYAEVHETAESSQASFNKSRDAFLVLMGLCSFFMSLLHERVPQHGVHIARWEPILKLAKFKLDYIQVIKASELTEFSSSYPRAGVFIESFDPDFQKYVDLYIRCGVPVWIQWGNVNHGRPTYTGILIQYMPLDDEVRQVRQDACAAGQPATQNTPIIDVQRVDPGSSASEFPMPHKASRQQRGESWKEFFARMDANRITAINRENSSDKQARLSREAAQKAHPRPGLSSKAARVFEWIEDDETGFLLRTPITRSLAQDYWHNYTEKQRRYNSILNEWDLCTELELDGVGRGYEDDDDDDDDVNMVSTSTQSQPTSLHPAQEPNLSPRAILPPASQPVVAALHNLIPLATRESTSQSPAVSLPESSTHNVETSSNASPLPHAHYAPQDCAELSSCDGTISSCIPPFPATSDPQPMVAALHDLISSVTPRESTPQSPVVPLLESSIHNVETSSNASPLPHTHYAPQNCTELSNCDGTMFSCIPPPPAITINSQDPALITPQPSVPASDDPILVAIPRESTPRSPVVLLPTPTRSDETPLDSPPSPAANFAHQECTERSNGNRDIQPSPAIASRDHASPDESAIHPMIPLATCASQADSSFVQSSSISTSRDTMPMSITYDSSSAFPPVGPADLQMADGVTTVAESAISASDDVAPMPITRESSTLPPITSADAQVADGLATVADQDVLDVQPGVMHDLIYNSPVTPLFPLLFTGTLADDVYEQYGFIGLDGDAKVDQQLFEWSDVRKLLGDGNQSEDRTWSIVRKSFGDVDSFVDPGLQVPLTYFLAMLLHPIENPLKHLPSLWDIAADSVEPFADHMNAEFRLVRDARSANSDAIYFISAKDRVGDDVHWQIMLTDAATVLACFRQEQAHTMRDLALFLLQCGRPFSTRIQRSKMQFPPPALYPPLAVLGWRPQNHRPTVSEYNFYENLRRAFFTDHGRARAALLKGGIIWRLAVEGSGGLIPDRVLGGPSEEALVCGTCLASVNERDSLWDDELSESDMDLICGVYKYATGEFL